MSTNFKVKLYKRGGILGESKLKELMNMDLGQLKNKLLKKPINEKKKPAKKKKEINRKVVSFDIGSEFTKIVIGKYFNGKLEIEYMDIMETPEEAVLDGNLINMPILTNFLQKEISKRNIKVKDGICTNNSTLAINREIVIPAVEDNEMETLVKYEIQQYLPINMDDYIIQYNVLETFKVEGQEKLKTLVVTYPEKMANNYYKLLSEVNLKPLALDITYNSLNKLINYSNKINNSSKEIKEGVVFIDMGANSLDVNIYKNGKLEFTRIIKSGGSNIDVLLSKSLNISVKDAEIEKKNKGYLVEDGEQQDLVNVAIKESVDEWLSELERIIQFYKNKKIGNTIEKIYLYGGSSNIRGIEKYIYSKFDIVTERVSTIDNIDLKLNLATESIDRYLNAIGAIIRL